MLFMENKPNNKMPTIRLGCMSWTGVFLSAAIIAVRAFQNGAQPIENWSVGSWFLMLLPIVFPIIFWLVLLLVWFIGYVLTEAFPQS